MSFLALFALAAALAAPKASPAPPVSGRVVGRVELLTGGPLPKGCRVLLAPPTPAIPDRVDTAKRLAELTVETLPNEQGFFQFAGVKPGTYAVRAEHKDFSPAEESPIVVRAGLDTELSSPLTLRPLALLTVQIDPPLDPFDRRWRLQLDREASSQDATRAGNADETGVWRESGLLPGRWHLRILGDRDGIWADQPIEIDGADQFTTVAVEVLAVEGRAFQGDEPFRGTLWFGGARGARRVRFDPDENGQFLGLLPEEGEWEVQAESPGAGLDRLTLEPVEVRRRPGQSKARVEIQVPDTRLEGRVVDEAGRGVAARLTLIAERRPSLASSEEDGRFLLRGLPAGVVSIQAETEDLASEPQQIPLGEGDSTPEVTIVVHGRTRIRGVVRTAQGPLPGAEVYLWPALEQGGMVAMTRAVTNPDGSFEAAISGSARTVDTVVAALGYGLSLSRQSIPAEGPLLLDLESGAGGIEIHFPPGEKNIPQNFVLIHRGAFVPAALLREWGTFDAAERRLVLPTAEPGDWTLCDRFGPGRDTASSKGCVQGALFSGGRLALETGSR